MRLRFLTLDALVVALLIAGLYQLREKSAIDGIVSQETAVVTVGAQARQGLRPGDSVCAIDGRRVLSGEAMELITDRYAPGDSVDVIVSRVGARVAVRVALEQYYDVTYFAIVVLTGLVFLILGVGVMFKRPNDPAARLFHHVMICAAMLVLLSPGRYTVAPPGLGHLVRCVFGTAFVFFAALLVHFTLVFPKRKGPWIRTAALFLYLSAGVLTVNYAYAFLITVMNTGGPETDIYAAASNLQSYFFVACSLMAIAAFVHSYRTATMVDRRTKLRWILAGFLIGPLCVSLLYFLPRVLGGASWIGEDVMTVFAGFSAILFAVAIVRHRVLDVEFLVTRGTVYGIVLALLAALYVGIVSLLAAAIGTTFTGSTLPPVIAATLVAMAFTPVRIRVQTFVDKRFFRVRYDVREAQRRLVEEIVRSADVPSLAAVLVQRTAELMPVERIGFLTMSPSGTRLQLEAHRGFDVLERHGVAFSPELLRSALHLPVARDGRVEPGLDIESGDPAMFDRWGIAMVFTVLSERDSIFGFLVLGPRLSGQRFSMEDVALLSVLAVQAGLTIDRIALQQQLVVERTESERLQELNALKSYFVSSVSHELKTPLTSIRMYAELLDSAPDLPRETSAEYLGIIEGESARLARLIDNVLDFSKIERGAKEYRMADVRVNDVVDYVMRSMAYQFRMNGFEVETIFDPRLGTIRGDADAIAEAVINLLANAIKYSTTAKQVVVETRFAGEHAEIIVRDRGIGIAPEERERIFEPFFRSVDPNARRAGGTGLGLALVRHIMDAHAGSAGIDSAPGEGTTVTLTFPITIS